MNAIVRPFVTACLVAVGLATFLLAMFDDFALLTHNLDFTRIKPTHYRILLLIDFLIALCLKFSLLASAYLCGLVIEKLWSPKLKSA